MAKNTNSDHQLPESIQKRLQQYALITGAGLAAAAPAKAGIIYTDVDPDVDVSLSNFSIDMNGDGITDFTLRHYGYSYMGTFGFSSAFRTARLDAGLGNQVMMPPLYGYGAAALNYGTPIGPSGAFSPFSGFMASYFMFYSSYGGFSSSYGPWSGVGERYAGVSFQIGPNIHYGWIRMEVGPGINQVTIKDFAYDDVPNTPINAGDATPAAFKATMLMADDIADAGDATDLELSFTMADDEATVGEYRMIVHKASADPLLLADAEALPAARYTAMAPTGSDVITTFPGTAQDTDGDLVIPGVAYRCYVMSTPDGVLALRAALSDPSNEVTLLANASPASNVQATDVANTNSGEDMQVSFDPAPFESSVGEYRIMVVETADAPGFNLAAANAVVAGNYTQVAPSGASVNVLLPTSAKTVDGTFIESGTPYTIFVLSVADGTVAQSNVLSTSTFGITLELTSSLPGFAEGGPKAWTAEGRLFWTSDHGGEYRFIGLDGRVIDQGQYASGEGQMPLPQAHQGIVELTEDGQRYTLRWSH